MASLCQTWQFCRKQTDEMGLKNLEHSMKWSKTSWDKRAMMALDRSPEPFSPQNEFYLLYYYCSNLWPRGGSSFHPSGIIWIELIKVHKAMPHTKNQSSRPSRFREEQFWILPSLFLCSNLWPPGRANLDPRGIIWTNLVGVNMEILHTKYQSSMPSIFREEEFWRWGSLVQCLNLWNPRPQKNRTIFHVRAIIWSILVEHQ